jgi:hypothetical protein
MTTTSIGISTDSPPPRVEPVAPFCPLEWLNDMADVLTKGYENLLSMRETERLELEEIPEWELKTKRADLEFTIRQRTDYRMGPMYKVIREIKADVLAQEAHWTPEQVQARALASQDATRQQATVARIARVPDHGLVAAQEQAVSAGDLPTAVLILAEAQQRPDIPVEYKTRIQGLLATLPLPGRDAALASIKRVKQDWLQSTITYLPGVSPEQKLTWARELGL